MAELYKVYCYTNTLNGKKYIGITSTSLENRAGANGYRYKGCLKFISAIQKYGFGNFVSEILYDNLTKEEAESKEIELIEKFNTTNNKFGYNISEGGKVKTSSEETRKKISVARKEYCKTHNVWNKGKKNVQKIWNKGLKMKDVKPDWVNPNKGSHLTEQTKKKISEKNKCYYKTHNAWNKGIKLPYMPSNATKVICIETNVVYESIAEAARHNNIKSNAGICMCCKGKRPSASGYHWCYVTGDKK